MKHLLLTVGATALTTLGAWAQCSADFDFMGAPFGVSPNPALGETFVEGQVNQPYEDVLHVILPTTTGAIPGAPLDVPLDSLILDSLNLVGEMGETITLLEVGLTMSPNNNGDSGNPNAFLGGGQYCASVTGMPDTAGVFMGQFFTTAWVTVPVVGPNAIPFPLEGYTLVINPEPVPGCMDETACNYDPAATEDDGSCTYPEPLLDCDGNCLYDPDMDGVCDDVEGCTDETACNYDPYATVDDGSCTFAVDFYDCEGNCLNDEDMDGICDELEVAGCTSPYACNYDETATDDDGSCVVVGDACDDGDDTTENDAIDENCDCVGEPVTGVAGAEDRVWHVYPNPAADVLNVELPARGTWVVTLTSVSGAFVLATATSQGGSLAVDVSQIPAGSYVLAAENADGRVVKHVLLGAR